MINRRFKLRKKWQKEKSQPTHVKLIRFHPNEKAYVEILDDFNKYASRGVHIIVDEIELLWVN